MPSKNTISMLEDKLVTKILQKVYQEFKKITMLLDISSNILQLIKPFGFVLIDRMIFIRSSLAFNVNKTTLWSSLSPNS